MSSISSSPKPTLFSSPILKPCIPPSFKPHNPISNKTDNKKGRTNTLSLRCNAHFLADITPATSDAAADLAPVAAAAPDLAPAVSAAYGVLLLGGGLFAYARSGSKGSVLGGLSGAALMAAAYYLLQSPETKEIGNALGFGSAFLFSSVFGIRLASTRKLLPSGLLLTVSVGALAVFLSAYMQDKI